MAVKFLVDECAVDINPVDRWGGTPLDDAMRSRHALVANYLRASGGRPGVELLREESEREAAAKPLESERRPSSSRFFR